MAAGLGFKTFTTGEVLTAGDVNGYLMQGINVFATTTARNAAITAPQEGQFAFTKDTNSLWYYDGAAWVASGATGDIEGVSAGVGISGGGTSGTVTVTNSMATAIDAKGDLVPGTGADTFARLAVGANNTVLTADSAEATGLKWATPAGPSGYTLLNSGGTALSGSSTVTVSSITSNDLLIYVTGAATTGTNINMTYKFNSSATGHYAAGMRIVGGSSYAASNFDQIQEDNSGAIPFSYTSSSASRPSRGYLMVQGCTSTAIKPLWFAAANDGGGGSGQWSFSGGGYFGAAAAITSVSLVIASGTFNAGTLFVYGRN